MKTSLLVLAVVISIIGGGGWILKPMVLKQNCTGYLGRAADANTVEMAKAELSKAITYLEENELTKGYTSVFYKTPSEDIGFWYRNLKASYNELDKVDSSTVSMERTNLLMKLRETLLEGGKEGDTITHPDGLAFYPNNLLWGIFRTITLLAFLLLCGIGAAALENKY